MKWMIVRLGGQRGQRPTVARGSGSGAKVPKAPPLTTFELKGRRAPRNSSVGAAGPQPHPSLGHRRRSPFPGTDAILLSLDLTFWRFLPQRLSLALLTLSCTRVKTRNSCEYVVNISIWKSCCGEFSMEKVTGGRWPRTSGAREAG